MEKNGEKITFGPSRPTFLPPRHQNEPPLIITNDLTSKARAQTNLLLNQGQCRAHSGLQNQVLHQNTTTTTHKFTQIQKNHVFKYFFLRNNLPLVFLSCPYYIITNFFGRRNGFFRFFIGECRG